jgi:hypothetical protein
MTSPSSPPILEVAEIEKDYRRALHKIMALPASKHKALWLAQQQDCNEKWAKMYVAGIVRDEKESVT